MTVEPYQSFAVLEKENIKVDMQAVPITVNYYFLSGNQTAVEYKERVK